MGTVVLIECGFLLEEIVGGPPKSCSKNERGIVTHMFSSTVSMRSPFMGLLLFVFWFWGKGDKKLIGWWEEKV